MATYGTDLTTLTDAESGTWVELTNYAAGGAPASETENYIQGVSCQSQTTGTKTGLVFSIAYDYGSDASGLFSAGDVILMWQFYAVGPNLETYANGGLRMGVFDSLTVGDAYAVGGRDYGRNPYGGWMNVAIDPTRTADYADGGGSAGAWRYFVSFPYTLAAISKGNPHAVDAIRYGRGEIYCTGTGANFTDMATYNDYNDATNGYNRFGLFSYQSGVFLWKGLLSFGQSATSVTFSDSNKNIIIDNAEKTYLAFNKMEVNNASSSVSLTNCSFSSLSTVSPGQFVVVDNATVDIDACTFKDMDIFTFQSNTTVTGTTFLRCNTVTQGSSSISNSVFSAPSGTKALVANNFSTLSNLSFISSGTGYAIEGFSTATSYTLTGITYSGYAATSGSTGNECLHILATSGTVTIYYPGGDAPTYHTEGATVVLVGASYDFKFTVNPSITGYEWRIYSVTTLGSLAGATELDGEESAIADNQTYTYTYTADTNIAVQIISQPDEDYEEKVEYFVLKAADQTVTINLEQDQNN